MMASLQTVLNLEYRIIIHMDGVRLIYKHIATCRPIARERVDKHVSMEVDSWKATRYGTSVRGYE
jgi:hypothetical protein